MRTIPRERTATPAELAEDRRRWERATEATRPLSPRPEDEPDTGGQVRFLAYFAAWRPCVCCGAALLFVDEDLQTTGRAVCGSCESRRAALARELAPKARITLRAVSWLSTAQRGLVSAWRTVTP